MVQRAVPTRRTRSSHRAHARAEIHRLSRDLNVSYCNKKMAGLTFGCCNSPAFRWFLMELHRDGRFRGCNTFSWEWNYGEAEQQLLRWDKTLVVTFVREPIFHVLSQISHHYLRKRVDSVAHHLSGERKHRKVYDSHDMQARRRALALGESDGRRSETHRRAARAGTDARQRLALARALSPSQPARLRRADRALGAELLPARALARCIRQKQARGYTHDGGDVAAGGGRIACRLSPLHHHRAGASAS